MKNKLAIIKERAAATTLCDPWELFVNSDVLAVRHDADCGYEFRGAAYSPIVDSVVELCTNEGLRVVSVATPYSRLKGRDAFNKPLVLNRRFLSVALLGRLSALAFGKSKARRHGEDHRTAIWRKVLSYVRPRLVIGVQPDRYLCRASREMGIPVYDIQHGVIAADHWWYGKALRQEVPESDLPTGILCWDRPSAAVLEQWAPARGVAVAVVGHPWFQRFRSPSSADDLVAEALQRGPVFNNDRPTALVSLQWGLHIHYYSNTDFNKVMCKALETVILRTQGRYNWLLRLHPVQRRGVEGRYCEAYLQEVFGDCMQVEWEQASLAPLPVLLAQADLHITDMSTVVTEAAWLGVPSALLNPFLRKGGTLESLYQYERQIGLASLVEQDADAIESWMDEQLSKEGVLDPGEWGSNDGLSSLLKNALVMND